MAIKAVLLDVDGTLAGDSIFYFRSGDVARVFSTYDGEGISLLKQHGIDVAIVTKSSAREIQNRAEWLNIRCFMGIDDKVEFLEWLSLESLLELDEICFMGNDLNDLGAMKLCGYPVAPHNANMTVWDYCRKNGYVTDAVGGNGAVRELADHLILYDFFDAESPIDPDFVHPPYP